MSNTKKHIQIVTKDGQPFPVPPEGSLGLLALGYVGLVAWRQVRTAFIQQMKEAEAAKAASGQVQSQSPDNEASKKEH
ncbi:MAG TPA: hypothetical protein DHW15_04180 [Bacteroidetes bacterium]|jgi:hypothetical protein|nr:MAG: hypothetical protein ABR94_02920 [Sphingobacteriales bacterium BACL12 MAG-120802-bin5]KRP13626.1 MAG: hypothetical protein ABR95_04480 [Sphingobacteriales bacterium BACL12 MAG-120813-bin55]HCK21370.1 hypothetical protein [Bacteroidota bacterium]